jgi:hypothetical protein
LQPLGIKTMTDTTTPPPVATGRTPQDYAIEHAEYMAKGAEHLLAALNVEDALRLRQEESADVDADDMHAAGTTRAEAAMGLRADIYAFRKRRARALLAQQPSGDEALLRQAMETLSASVPVQFTDVAVERRKATLAALHARLEGTK